MSQNGVVRGKQRYKCKLCGCNYTQSSMHRISINKRAEAIRLYMEGVGFRAIERLLGVSNVSVMGWVKKLGDKIEQN